MLGRWGIIFSGQSVIIHQHEKSDLGVVPHKPTVQWTRHSNNGTVETVGWSCFVKHRMDFWAWKWQLPTGKNRLGNSPLLFLWSLYPDDTQMIAGNIWQYWSHNIYIINIYICIHTYYPLISPFSNTLCLPGCLIQSGPMVSWRLQQAAHYFDHPNCIANLRVLDISKKNIDLHV